jgi:hypothetical protein
LAAAAVARLTAESSRALENAHNAYWAMWAKASVDLFGWVARLHSRLHTNFLLVFSQASFTQAGTLDGCTTRRKLAIHNDYIWHLFRKSLNRVPANGRLCEAASL